MEPIRGLTADSVAGVLKILPAVKALGFRPLIRIVLDPGTPLTYYDWRVRQISTVADVMIQFGDSSAMMAPAYAGFADWKKHVDDALRMFRGYAKSWEVSNEPNQPPSFIGASNYDKCRYARDACRDLGEPTVATYLMGAKADSAPGCYFPDYIARNPLIVDVVLSSCYLYQLFPKMPVGMPAARAAISAAMVSAKSDLVLLAKACPEAKGIGWGEFGGELTRGYVPIETRAELCRQFYSATMPTIPNFIGGCFYWDWIRDCVKNPDKAQTVQTAIIAGCKGGA